MAKNLLIVEDDIDCADALVDMLQAEGYEVRAAYNGEEGLRLAHDRLPDLALLDVEMPVLDGPGMAYQMWIRDRGLEDVPLILLSGAIALPQIAARVGTPYYLAKPYRYELISALIRRALTEHVRPRPPERPSDEMRL